MQDNFILLALILGVYDNIFFTLWVLGVLGVYVQNYVETVRVGFTVWVLGVCEVLQLCCWPKPKNRK